MITKKDGDHPMITISHTHAEGTLLCGTCRGDGSAQILRPLPWRWGRALNCWYLPRSRDNHPNRDTIEQTRDLLQAEGYTVTVVIDDTPRPAAQVEDDRTARAAERAERLASRAARHHDLAREADRTAERAAEALPPGGEPVKLGTSGARRHLRALDRAHTTMSASVAADRQAAEAERRADLAASATDRRTSPESVARRLEQLGVELRSVQRQITGHTRIVSRGRHGQAAITETTTPATGARLAELEADAEIIREQIIYWGGIRERQLLDGLAHDFSAATVKPGDLVRIRGQWRTVVRASAKSVTVKTSFSWNDRAPWHEVSDHRSPTSP